MISWDSSLGPRSAFGRRIRQYQTGALVRFGNKSPGWLVSGYVSDVIISTHALVKEFRTVRPRIRALDRVDLTVNRGEAFGLLGANGAGKTTLVKVLLGLTRADSGTVEIRGASPGRTATRRRIGYLPEGHRFPGYLSADAAMRLFGRLAGVAEDTLDRRIGELLDLVGLAERRQDHIGRFSKGMTQRLGLAAALIDDPDVLFLDEPTDGVDPVGRREIRDILKLTKSRGTTVFINSHLLSEVERTCDRVAILHRGQVIREGSVEELTRPTRRFRLRAGDGPAIDPGLIAAAGASLTHRNGFAEVDVPDLVSLNALIDTLRQHGILIAELTPVKTELEDVFIEVVQEEQAHETGATPTAGAGEVTP